MFNKLLPPTYRLLRKRAKLSQEQLAKLLGTCRTNVYYYETGKARPDLEQEQQLIDLSRCSELELAEMLCEQLSELLERKVAIADGGEYRPATALAAGRELERRAKGKVSEDLRRALANQIQAAEHAGLLFEQLVRGLEEVADLCRREMEKGEDPGEDPGEDR